MHFPFQVTKNVYISNHLFRTYPTTVPFTIVQYCYLRKYCVDIILLEYGKASATRWKRNKKLTVSVLVRTDTIPVRYWFKTRLSRYFDEVGDLYLKYSVRWIFLFGFLFWKLEGMSDHPYISNVTQISGRLWYDPLKSYHFLTFFSIFRLFMSLSPFRKKVRHYVPVEIIIRK